MTFRAIEHNDSSNGFGGWIEFEADDLEAAWVHATNIFGFSPNVTVEEITD